MNKEVYELLKNNYAELFNNYCKYQNKLTISSSSTSCEDLFNDKILYFIECDVQNPTLDILKIFLRTKRKDIKNLKGIEYKDCYINETEIVVHNSIEDKIQYLFIDYRKK